MLYPGGEMAAFAYNDRGMLSSESQLLPDGTLGTAYRTINAMSPRAQITQQVFGNHTTEAAQYDDSTGMATCMRTDGPQVTVPTNCTSPSDQLIRIMSYKYDQFLNLSTQTKSLYQRDATGAIVGGTSPVTEAITESYAYDELQRLLSATRTWPSGMTVSPQTRASDTYTYDVLGNIIGKSDYADNYQYNVQRPDHTPLPHAVGTVSVAGTPKPSFSYDENGNMTGGDGRQVTYDNLDRPITVSMGSTTVVQFRYAPDGNRYVQSTSGGSNNEYYAGKLFEQVETGVSIEARSHVSDIVEIVQTGTR
jgi:hypothetical protein